MTPGASLVDTLRTPSFALFWSAQASSRFGDPITLIALATVTYALTGSALFTALAVVVTVVPAAGFGFFAGAIADAVGHRRAMVGCDVVRFVLIGAIPLLLGAGVPLAVPYLLVFASSTCTAIFNTARVAIVPALVPLSRLGTANSVVYATDRTVEILGALAGGLLVAAIGERAFYVDAATFAVSAVLLRRVRLEELPRRALSWTRGWSDAAIGLAFVRHHAILRANTIFSLIAQLSIPILNGLLPVLIFRRFAAGDPERGAALFGTAEAAIALGAVGAGVLMPVLMGRFRKGSLLISGFALYGATVVLVALAPTFSALVAVLVVAGMTNVLFFVPNVTIAQEVTPPELRARVFGARIALLSLSWLPILLAGGALADVVDVTLLLLVAGAVTLVTSLAALAVRPIRDVA
ncbi:MAG: MFS transporter [Candidatus Limnocylindria bacterium]